MNFSHFESRSVRIVVASVVGTLYTVLFWHRLILRGEIPFHVDTLLFYFPNWFVGNRLWSEGGSFLWDTYRNLGQPFLGSPQNQILYPVRISGLFLSLKNYMQLFIVFHTILAAVFGYLLCREWTKDIYAGMIGALGFGFAGPFFLRVVYLADFASIAWLPACLFFLTIGSVPGLSIALTFQVFAGYPPFTIVTTVTLLILCYIRPPFRAARLKCLLVAALLALGLSAIQWIPFMEMLLQSGRPLILDSRTASVGASAFSDLGRGFFLPGFLWDTFEADIKYRAGFYLGPFIMGLAVIGVIKGNRMVRWMGTLSLAGFVLALGPNNYFYSYIPFIKVFRFPGNWLVMGSALMILTAVHGLLAIPSPFVRRALVALIAFDFLLFSFPPRFVYGVSGSISPLSPSTPSQPSPFFRIMHDETIVKTFGSRDYAMREDWDYLIEEKTPSFSILLGQREAASNHAMPSRRNLLFRKKIMEGSNRERHLKTANVQYFVRKTDRGFSVDDIGPGYGRAFYADREGAPVILEDRSGFFRIDAEGPGTLVVSECFNNGWRAVVDAEPQSIDDYEGVFISIPLSTGRHKITLRYDPATVKWGWGISLLSFLLWGGTTIKKIE